MRSWTGGPRWLNLWQSEARFVAQDGTILAYVQMDTFGNWDGFLYAPDRGSQFSQFAPRTSSTGYQHIRNCHMNELHKLKHDLALIAASLAAMDQYHARSVVGQFENDPS